MTATRESFPGRRSTRRGRYVLRITAEQRDFATFALWCCTTFVQFRGDELILYPLALYYAWAIWRDQAKIVPLLARSWVIMVYPIWCLISPLWAVMPLEAFKQSLYLILTMMICYQVAATLSPRRIFHALLLAAGVIGTINFAYAFATGHYRTGIFVQKNYMGKYMVVLWTVSSAVVLDRGSAIWIRIGGVALSVIAAVMGYLSDSTTALLLIFATGMLNLAGAIFLQGGITRASRLSGLFLFFAILVAGLTMVAPSLPDNPTDVVLKFFNKDSTLTGRTDLWAYAEDQIREAPFLGVGFGGFWRYNASPLVQKIYLDFHKGPHDVFNFHNSYYEIAVHEGLVGLGLAVFALIWGLAQIFRGAFRFATIPQVYFLTQALAVAVRTTTEADFFGAFVLFHMILWIGALSAQRMARIADDPVPERVRRQPVPR